MTAVDAVDAGMRAETPALTRSDRCDRCPAAARVRAVLWSGELLFCAHHARTHRGPLLAAGATLIEADGRSTPVGTSARR